jgi:hypothetical protein
MTASDRAWELAGLARQDGDHAEELRWTNIARGLPPETVRLKCWPCVGNGLIAYPRSPVITCPDCNGNGWVPG